MNILIVESENDEYFIKALAKSINKEFTICKIDDFKHSSLSEKKLKSELFDIFDKATKEKIEKVGIILDMDDSNAKDRIGFINRCIISELKKISDKTPLVLLTDLSQAKNLV